MLISVVLISLGMLIVAQPPVYAYVDPGSGALLWQILLAAVFGLMFYVRKIIAWFRRLNSGRKRHTSIEVFTAVPEKDADGVKGQVL